MMIRVANSSHLVPTLQTPRSRKYRSKLIVGLIFCWLASVQVAHAQTPPESRTPSTPIIPKSSTDPAGETESGQSRIASDDGPIIADIREIRAMLGGGLEQEFAEIQQIIKPLSELPSARLSATPDGGAQPMNSLECQSTESNLSVGQLFERELAAVMRRTADPKVAQGKPPTSNTALAESTSDAGLDDSNGSARLTSTPIQGKLRQCARDLEEVAEKLETLRAYQNADLVRQQAVELWTRARQVEP